MTQDGELAILHGGDNGELNHHFNLPQVEYIFDKTLDELRQYDMGEGEKVPTLLEVINLVNKSLMINIEVKAPHDPHIKKHYDYKKAITMVHETIVKSSLENHCCVSSFDSDVLEQLDLINREQRT